MRWKNAVIPSVQAINVQYFYRIFSQGKEHAFATQRASSLVNRTAPSPPGNQNDPPVRGCRASPIGELARDRRAMTSLSKPNVLRVTSIQRGIEP